MGETGTVVAVEGGDALVRIERHEACSRCGACSVVGEHLMEVSCLNGVGALVGDVVGVCLPSGSFMRTVLVTYGGMLAAFLVGAFGGAALSGIDLIGLVCGGCCLVLYAFVLRRVDKAAARPYITRL